MNPTPEYIKVVLTVPLKEWKHLRTFPTTSVAQALEIANGVHREVKQQEPEFYICPECKQFVQALQAMPDIEAYCESCEYYLRNHHKVTNLPQLLAGNC